MSPIKDVSLVKEQTKPEVYFFCRGTKFSIPSEQEFNAVGFQWSKVQTVPDGTLAAIPDKPFVAPPKVKASDVFLSPRVPRALHILGPTVDVRPPSWRRTLCSLAG